MILYEHVVRLKPGQEVTIAFIGDVHWNLEESDNKLFASTVKYLEDRKKSQPVRVIGLGDYLDPFSTSERETIRKTHDSTLRKLDKDLLELTHEFMVATLPLKGCWLGVHEGHHYHEFQHRKTRGADGKPLFMVRNTEYYSKMMGAKYFGVVARGAIIVNGKPFKIMSTHGFGFSRTENGQVLKRKRMAEAWSGDCFVQGHDHQLFIRRGKKKDDNGKKLQNKYSYYIASGSYLDGYPVTGEFGKYPTVLPISAVGDPYGTYIEGKLYDPPTLGSAMVHLSINKKGNLHVKTEEFEG